MTKPKTLDQLRAEKERAETQLAQEQHRLTGQMPSVWKIFSVHGERRLSKADENTAGKNMTA